MLQGVVEEVGQHLARARGVRLHGLRGRLFHLDTHVLAVGDGAEALRRRGEERRGRDRFEVERLALGLELREPQHALHQVAHALQLLVEEPEEALAVGEGSSGGGLECLGDGARARDRACAARARGSRPGRCGRAARRTGR